MIRRSQEHHQRDRGLSKTQFPLSGNFKMLCFYFVRKMPANGEMSRREKCTEGYERCEHLFAFIKWIFSNTNRVQNLKGFDGSIFSWLLSPIMDPWRLINCPRQKRIIIKFFNQVCKVTYCNIIYSIVSTEWNFWSSFLQLFSLLLCT